MANKVYFVLVLGIAAFVGYAVYAQKKRNAEYANELTQVAKNGELALAYETSIKVEVGFDNNRRYEKFNPGDEITENGAKKSVSNAIVTIKVFPEDKNKTPFEAEWFYENLPIAEIERIATLIHRKRQQPFAVKYRKSQTEAGKYTVAQLDATQYQRQKTTFDALEKRARQDASFWPAQ
ncbi:MAG: hypothetical protein JXX14_23780 [Deltaproteobacteria bacterium]|nr:hypothetical protein [Deltaproteobacteria bacterium]